VLWTLLGPRNYIFDEVQVPHAKGQFWEGKGRPIVKYRDLLWWAVVKLVNWTIHVQQITLTTRWCLLLEGCDSDILWVGLKQISFNIYYSVATRGHMSPIAVSPYYQLLSLWRHSSTALAAPILIMMSIAAELATPSITDERTYRHLTAFNI